MAFLNFGRFEEDRIVELDDRRVIFLPKGRGGPVYLVPDDETRTRLERRYRFIDRALNLALPVLSFGAMHYRRWDLAVLAVVLVSVVPWWTARTTIERLPEIADPAAVHGTRRRSADEPAGLKRLIPDRWTRGAGRGETAAREPENGPVEPRWRG